MFSINKLITGSIICRDLTRSVSFARGRRFGYNNCYMSGRPGPSPNHKPFYKFYDNSYQFHHKRGLRPKVIIGMIILGLFVCKYAHTPKDQNHRSRDKDRLLNGKGNDLPASPVSDENQSSEP